MIEFRSRSQAGQDTWVYDLLVKPTGFTTGTFVDIGCGHPTDISNTFALEELGWRGLLVDVEQSLIDLCLVNRKSMVLKARGESMDWMAHLEYFTRKLPHGTLVCDYLSLDCDEATNPVLKKLLTLPLRFRCMTVEHDAYRFGDGPRAEQRALLTGAGYKIERADVAGQPGFEFEDWYVDPLTME